MSDWEVFQRDVLDVLRQYEGYLDFFERVGSLSDDSRPDCFARISRDEKKEVWVLDAKAKGEIDEEDRERMQKYLEMLKSNPIDAGLEVGEISEHEFRGIFVTQSDAAAEDFETVKFSSLHQFMQKELVYTDTDKAVRDLAKMVERKKLTQSQARLLHRSIKPFQRKMDDAYEVLEKLEEDFVGLELQRPPFDEDIPVDAVLHHKPRKQKFLFDIPYSKEAVENVEKKVEEVRERIGEQDNIYFAAIDTFGEKEDDYTVQLENIRQEIMNASGIVSPVDIAEMFEPKIRTEKVYTDSGIELRDQEEIGFRLKVETHNDVNHRIEVLMPPEASSRLKETLMNARQEFGEITNGSFRQSLEITSDFNVSFGEREIGFESYQDAVKSLFHSSVNPVLGKKVTKKV